MNKFLQKWLAYYLFFGGEGGLFSLSFAETNAYGSNNVMSNKDQNQLSWCILVVEQL